jgi:hypothetical protein
MRLMKPPENGAWKESKPGEKPPTKALRIRPVTTVSPGLPRAPATIEDLWKVAYTPPQGTDGLISVMQHVRMEAVDGPPRWLPNKARIAEKVVPDARKQVEQILTGQAPWPLLIIGQAGAGKTCLGLILADTFTGLYSTLPDLVLDVGDAMYGRATYATGHPRTSRELWNDWANATLPVLDEIGTRSNVSEHQYDVLKRALDRRENLPAVYISNHGISEITRLYDDRIASRLSAGTIVMLNGGDRRSKGAPVDDRS